MTESAKIILRRLLKVLKVLGIVLGILWVIIIILLQLVLTESFLTEAVNKYVPEAIEGARLEFKHINATAIRSFPYLRITMDTVAVVYDHDKYADYDAKARIDNVLSNLGRAQEADTLFALSKMSVGVNYLSLIFGTIDIHDVQVDGMRVFARQFGSEDANWNIFKASEEEETEEEDSELPDIVLRNFGMDDGAFVIYNNAQDTLFAAIALRRLAFDGKIPIQDLIGGCRIGLQIDSVFVAGRTASDTIATGLDFLNIHRRRRGFHELELKGGTFVSLSDGTRMSVPAGLGIRVRFPNRDMSRVQFEDLRVNVASAEATGSGDIAFFGEDTTSIKADLAIPRCDIAALLRDFAPLIGPDAGKIKTDAVISASLRCDGLYVPESGALPALTGEFKIPHSNISVEGISGSGYLQADVKVSTDENGRLDGKLSGMDVNMGGLRVKGDASAKDLMGVDPALWMDLVANADLQRLSEFLPEDMSASGKIEAGLKGQARLSHLNLHNFSSADLEGYLYSDGLHYADSAITAYLGKTSLSLEKSKNRMAVESGKVLVLEGGADTLSVDMLPATNLRASGVKISVRNADKIKLGDKEEYRPIMANVGVARLRMVGEDSLIVSLRGSENIFKASQKILNGKKAPLFFIKSDNKGLAFRQGRSRTALRGVGLEYSSSKEPVVRDNRRKRFLDSLQRVWPGVPRDSLFRKYMRIRGMHKLPDYLQDKSFREKDIHINLGESFTKYLREWTISGKAGIDNAIFITPSFPLRNKLSKLALNFNNNEIHLDSLSFRSGRSDISAKGSITGLRGVIGRSPRPAQVTLNATSRMLNFNELFAAMDAGQKYASNVNAAVSDTLSDADYLASFAIDSTQMTIEEYPLIVIPANINMNISLQGDNVKYSTLDIDKFSSEIAMKERCLQLKNTLAHSNMGNIDLEAFYSTRTRDDISLGFDLRLSEITADKVITMIPAADTLMPLLKTFTGTLNCELAATSDLDTNMNFITKSIAGILKIDGKNLEIQQNDAVRKITRLLLFKDKQKTTVDQMQVLAMISNNEIEVFPFALSLDRYRLALGGVQNFDNNFKYHLSVLKSPIPFKFGINITGNPDKWKWRFGGAKYKSINTPMYTQRIDTMHLNLVESIHQIFEKGAKAAVAENRRAADTAAVRRWILPGDASAVADTLSAGEKAQMDSLQFAYDHPDSTAVAVDSLSVKMAQPGNQDVEKVSEVSEKVISLQSLSDTGREQLPKGSAWRRASVTAFRKVSRVC